MSKSILFFFLLASVVFCIGPPVYAQTTINPAESRLLAQAATDVFRVMNSFHETVKTSDPFIFLDLDTVMTFSTFTIPTEAGDIPANAAQVDGLFSIRIVKTDDFSLRFFFIPVDLCFLPQDVTGMPYFEPGMLGLLGFNFAWLNGFLISGVQVSWGDLRFSLGLLGRTVPFISGPPGSEIFESTSAMQGLIEGSTAETIYDNIYFDFDLTGYTFNSLFSFSGHNQLGAEKLFSFGDSGFSSGPSLYWSSPLSLVEAGAAAAYDPFDWLSMTACAFAGYNYDTNAFGFTRANLSLKLPLVLLANTEYPERSFTLVFKVQSSIHMMDDQLKAGGFAEIEFSHIPWLSYFDAVGNKTFLTIALGAGGNVEEMLRRMPLPDNLLISIKFRVTVY